MSKREKIIILVACIAVLYGIYEFFLSSPQKGPQVEPGADSASQETFMTEISKTVATQGPSEKEAYIMRLAEMPWRESLFHELGKEELEEVVVNEPEIQVEPEPLPLEVNLSYSGYLEMGDRRIAIISGMEYQTGDLIDPGGYVVRAIHPTKIILELKKNKQTITLPIIEETL